MIIKEEITSKVESILDPNEALSILEGSVSITQVLDKAYQERVKYFSNKVRIQILDNIKNGHCSENCGYCAQRKDSNSGIQEYSTKSHEEIIQDALDAKKNGAYRFCMVTSGKGPTDSSIERLTKSIRMITNEIGLKVCLSAGILDESNALKLKDAGLDRYNHNLNTSEESYDKICNTHSYKDRMDTLEILRRFEIGTCSGMIVGMGESLREIVEVAFQLKKMEIASIPINFFIPVKGHAIENVSRLTPELCLRILCVFRLVNPDSEIRIGAGREGHLRGLQSMSLFPANSLFASGYLNVKGSNAYETVEMIRDAGFEPEFSGEFEFSEKRQNEKFDYSTENITNLYKFKKDKDT
ncbi:MAG: biotin synthase BioB [Leptospiraceae bacterium]|nr:biotin synthase BioB [Leptospiraceae bacterium]MCK6380674.1 biotin synthase BioB [Leptospiraceae bacterium]NUM41542.1 biotin synthase BioB [Leptospiraceae bacterium]